ncbi:MAG: Stk1 family PASTA domain-containing Ser/Thr kinase [Clostridia bacterium]|nr:Stk1 family PASTA domain-containing Ser/Thr kinase [Clostridia bacterium]
MELIGRILAGRYEIIEKIGEGGMAYVFKARDGLLNRYVAVKVLKEEYSKDEVFVTRFRTEAQSAASLIHPNIVSVFDVGEDKGVSFIVMELLESKTLKDYIQIKGALPSDITLKIAAQIASALEAAHKAHIVHRDIKPQNIILNQNLVAKVTDFGIAKVSNATTATITSFGKTMGSVHYFSPEHAKGGYTDAKSDLYSLGVVMYEMATGKLPFDAESAVSVALKHIQEEPIEPIELNPNVGTALNQIILKAMEKSTANRYQSATELLTDISIALSKPGTGLVARPQSSIEAGDTQVIPLLTDIEEENLIPNIRTRQSGARSAYIPTAREARVIDEERRPNNNQKSEALKKAKKKKVMIITAIFAVLIIVVGCFSGYFISKIINNGKEEEFEIPNLLGKNFEEIRTEYEAKGITVHQTSAEYNAEYEEGQIMTQRPDAGTKTTDKNIYVEVSKGTKLVKVTNIEGKDIKVAKYELENTLGFIVEQEEEVSEDVAAGLVISQEYKDVERPYGSVIKLKVSSGDGKAKVVVPTVVGKTIADAKKTLEDLKLKVETEYGEDEAKLNGTVLAQSYPQNSVLKEGDLIKLTVNRRVINKTVTVTGIPEGTKQSEITVKVSVDGGVMNSTTFSYDDEKYELSFAIDGYEKVSYNVMVNGSLIKSGEENF